MRAHIGGGPPDTEKSIADIKQNLGKHRNPKFNRVFKSLDHAYDDMKDSPEFAPYHLYGPDGVHMDDSEYSEYLVHVDNSIHKEEQDKKKKK